MKPLPFDHKARTHHALIVSMVTAVAAFTVQQLGQHLRAVTGNQRHLGEGSSELGSELQNCWVAFEHAGDGRSIYQPQTRRLSVVPEEIGRREPREPPKVWKIDPDYRRGAKPQPTQPYNPSAFRRGGGARVRLSYLMAGDDGASELDSLDE